MVIPRTYQRPAFVHDLEVAAQFDATAGRFKREVGAGDHRLRAVVAALGPLPGRLILDLGCGKGRFAVHLRAMGAEVVGLDVSAAMLQQAGGLGLERVRGSARRLPFADGAFDGVVAVEVLEHVDAVDAVIAEARRVLRPGGVLAIVDKNARSLDARRPWLPSVVVKWVDERRGRWMYPKGGLVRERWFGPGWLRGRLRRHFDAVRVEHLIRPEEASRLVFRAIPATRLMTLWSARVASPKAEDRSWSKA